MEFLYRYTIAASCARKRMHVSMGLNEIFAASVTMEAIDILSESPNPWKMPFHFRDQLMRPIVLCTLDRQSDLG